MRSSRQRGDQKRLRDIATCSPMPSLLGEDKGGIVKSRPQVHLAGNRSDLHTGLRISSSGIYILTITLS